MEYSFLAALSEHQHVPPCVVVRGSCDTLTAAPSFPFPAIRPKSATKRFRRFDTGRLHTPHGGCCNPLDTSRPLLSLAPSSNNAPCSPKQRNSILRSYGIGPTV